MRNNLKLFGFLFFAFLVVGCKSKSKEELIQGEWKFVGSYDVDSNKLIKGPELDDPIVLIKNETITIKFNSKSKKDDTYYWKIKQDSLFVTTKNNKNTFPFFLRTLNDEKLEVEISAFHGNTRFEYSRFKR